MTIRLRGKTYRVLPGGKDEYIVVRWGRGLMKQVGVIEHDDSQKLDFGWLREQAKVLIKGLGQ